MGIVRDSGIFIEGLARGLMDSGLGIWFSFGPDGSLVVSLEDLDWGWENEEIVPVFSTLLCSFQVSPPPLRLSCFEAEMLCANG